MRGTNFAHCLKTSPMTRASPPSGLTVDRLLPTPDRILSLPACAAPAPLVPCAAAQVPVRIASIRDVWPACRGRGASWNCKSVSGASAARASSAGAASSPSAWTLRGPGQGALCGCVKSRASRGRDRPAEHSPCARSRRRISGAGTHTTVRAAQPGSMAPEKPSRLHSASSIRPPGNPGRFSLLQPYDRGRACDPAQKPRLDRMRARRGPRVAPIRGGSL